MTHKVIQERLARYEAHQREEGKSESTIYNIRGVIRRFLIQYEGASEQVDVHEYLLLMKQRGRSRSYVRETFLTLKHFFTFESTILSDSERAIVTKTVPARNEATTRFVRVRPEMPKIINII